MDCRHSSIRITLFAMLSICFFSTSTMAAPTVEIEEWLQVHNNHRKSHGVSAVIWSEAVAVSAKAHADTCPSGHSKSAFGENLAWATYNMGVSQVVQMWYKEETDYDYNSPGFSSKTGHFTQVVWKATTEIGCASTTKCGGNHPYVWVCQYNPPGNYIGQFPENVNSPN